MPASVSVGASQRASSKQEILAGGYASAGAGSIGGSQGGGLRLWFHMPSRRSGDQPRHAGRSTKPRAILFADHRLPLPHQRRVVAAMLG